MSSNVLSVVLTCHSCLHEPPVVSVPRYCIFIISSIHACMHACTIFFIKTNFIITAYIIVCTGVSQSSKIIYKLSTSSYFLVKVQLMLIHLGWVAS